MNSMQETAGSMERGARSGIVRSAVAKGRHLISFCRTARSDDGMLYFHPRYVRPEILGRYRPNVLEVGIFYGSHTQELWKATVRRGGRLVAVDPLPGRGIRKWLRLLPLAQLMPSPSLEALPLLVARGHKADVVVIDGDHNYYTVSRELELMEDLLAPEGVVFLHDVGWPYGRRDVYYDPDRLPPSAVHHFRKGGMARGRSELLDKGGLNEGFNHARHEGGPHNGVLTAVEDFMEARSGQWQLRIIAEQWGLGILRRSGVVPKDPLDIPV